MANENDISKVEKNDMSLFGEKLNANITTI